jgi:hypothetical protein
VLVSVSFTLPIPVVPIGEIPTTVTLDQVNATFAVALVGVYKNGWILHIAAGVNVLLNVGNGLTVSVAEALALWHAVMICLIITE